MLTYEKLMEIAGLVHKYFPETETIGSFARVTDVALKSDRELASLRGAGYDGLTIGIETADDAALQFMDKGYLAADILEQCGRLDKAGIRYSFFYLTGISGAGHGEDGARATAAVCNELHPILVGANMLTVYPNAILYEEIRQGNWKEEGELEKYREVRALVQGLEIPTEFAALGASNAFQLHGVLPKDKETLIASFDRIIGTVKEDDLREYRRNLPHL